MTIGILRENKLPVDRRVPFSPEQCRQIIDAFKGVNIIVQPSNHRCFSDDMYTSYGIEVNDDISKCDVLFGVKEVQPNGFIPNKVYFIFSHTIKKQDYNKKLLKEVLDKKVRLVDYELLSDKNGIRLIGFGRFAGIVGAYNALRTYAHKNKIATIKGAHELSGYKAMVTEIKKVEFPPIRFAVTGHGRVANGALEFLSEVGVGKISVDEFLENSSSDKSVVAQLLPGDYVKHAEGENFDLNHFFKHPEAYSNNFIRFLPLTDVLIAGAYWDPNSPKLFTKENLKSSDFNIQVIADVTCDINGSMPTTLRASTITNPVYDYNKISDKEETAYSSKNNISIMAVDNLPCEMPREASISFGKTLIEKVLPELIPSASEIINKASIAKGGKLLPNYMYLNDWVNS
jgi:saccharopine dehydrogenase (NAD+, L-lysine-forming)